MSLPVPVGSATMAWTRREVLALVFLLVGPALILSFRLGDAPATINAEIRCWKVVSNMTATGEWIIPYRSGKPALNKPPLFYWAGSAISALAGGASYATLRAPSVMATLGVLALTFWWGRSIGGAGMGLVALFLLTLIFRVYSWGREGTFEMLLTLLTSLALFTFDRTYVLRRQSLLPLFFLLVLAAFLTKGPPALMIIGVPIVLFLALSRQSPLPLFCLLVVALSLAKRPLALAIIGLPILLFLLSRREIRQVLTVRIGLWSLASAVLGLLWFAVILYRVPGAWQQFFSEAVLPVGMETSHHTATHYHHGFYFFSRIFVIAAVPSALIPLFLWRAWKTRFWQDAPRLRFCAWIGWGLLFAFSFFPQKQHHYLLPVLPALAILLADSVLWVVNKPSEVHWAWLGVPAIALGIMAIILPAPVAFYFHLVLQTPLAATIAVCALSVPVGAGIIWLAITRRWLALAGLTLLMLWPYFAVYFGNMEIVKRQFATGEIEQRKGFDKAYWTGVKKSYPVLGDIFHRGSRFTRDGQEEP